MRFAIRATIAIFLEWGATDVVDTLHLKVNQRPDDVRESGEGNAYVANKEFKAP